VSDDPLRTYEEAEQRQLAENLFEILESIHAGHAGRPGQQLMLELHRQLFAGVRDHGGSRRPDHTGSDYLTFGPNRSVGRDEVVAELDRVFESLDRPSDPSRRILTPRTTT
jgi:fido (protein-threonine AMPylation protein)